MIPAENDSRGTERSDLLYALGFLAANLVLKLSLVRLNGGSYTDGIIQLQTTSIHPGAAARLGLYPPLYGDLCWLVARFGIGLEFAGRVVSAIAGSLTVLPVFYVARSVFGRDPARIAALLFTLSPLVLRWSIHTMTDSLFLFLATSSLYFIITAWAEARLSVRRLASIDWRLAWASIFAALATYTRYQGALLAAPLFVAMLVALRARCIPWRAFLGSITWLVPALFILRNSGVHGGQIASRTAGALVPTLAAYWNTVESFVLIAPYYFGYPIAAAAVVGVFATRNVSKTMLPFFAAFTLFGILLLLLQAVFGSFQYRYMMPVLPGVLALAGHGAHQLYLGAKARRIYWLYSAGMIVSLAYLALFSTAVLMLQRQTLSDQKSAADFLRVSVPVDARIFANERYGNFTELGCVKLSFWSGKKVGIVYDAETGRLKDLPGGSFVVVGNEYGGNEATNALLQQLRARYTLEEVQSPSVGTVVPLMDDIMVDPMFNQNATGWVLRYTPQYFMTRVLRVTGPAAGISR